MSDTNPSILDRVGLDRNQARKIVSDALKGADDGELYLEYSQAEGLMFDNGRLKTASFDTNQGFGLRAIAGEAAGYAHSAEISEAAIKRAGEAVQSVTRGYSGTYAAPPPGTNRRLYTDENPIGSPTFATKVGLLEKIDAHARAKDPRVRQVSASIGGAWKVVEILRADGTLVRDVRPMVRLAVSVVVGEGNRQETGTHSLGGRETFERILTEESWQSSVDEALRQALVNLSAVPTPAGTFDVVLGPGYPGVLLHEAVGHGLEGDFNRKKQSAFAGLMGERVAARGVTVVDDGTLPDRRGSITFDDEGTPSQSTTLIEDGVLVGYMQDRQNGRLMGTKSTGNGRRQGYSSIPMPRMTNTYMLAGSHDPAEIIASVKDGIYAVAFSGGQVDITNGKFVFGCTEAYRIENGKVGPALKNAMLIGSGPESLKHISMIGNDLQLDQGVGNCGKQGQWVPVGVGQPTLRIDGLTVGGSASR
jgi:TldD protein